MVMRMEMAMDICGGDMELMVMATGIHSCVPGFNICQDNRHYVVDDIDDGDGDGDGFVFRLSFLLILVGAFCMWIMWVCTWLMQWHPIIYPHHNG